MERVEIEAPSRCPECATPVEAYVEPTSGVATHWCRNAECPGRIADMLLYAADPRCLGIEGLADPTGPAEARALAQVLARSRYVVDLADLFELANDLASLKRKLGVERFDEQIARTMGLPREIHPAIDGARRAKAAPWDRWIAALSIPMVGRKLGADLARELGLGPEDMGGLPERLAASASMPIEGAGPRKRAEIAAAAADPAFQALCLRLGEAGVRPTPVPRVRPLPGGAPLEGVAFCMTGDLPGAGTREYVAEKLVSLGAEAKSGVTRKTTLLIVGVEPGAAKLNKAKALGIPLADEDWVLARFREHGVPAAGNRFDLEDWD